MQVTIENVRPLVEREDLQGGSLKVTFVCRVSGERVEAYGAIKADNEGLATMVRRGVIDEMIGMLRRKIYRMFGRGMVGRFVRDLAGDAMWSTAKKLEYSKAEQDRAIVEAFERVREEHFVWDPDTDQWIHASVVEFLRSEV